MAIKKVTHHAYRRIIGLGPEAISLILRELQRRPCHWSWALKAIVGEATAQQEDNVSETAQPWIGLRLRVWESGAVSGTVSKSRNRAKKSICHYSLLIVHLSLVRTSPDEHWSLIRDLLRQ
jgi:hypothetical protein